METITLHGRNFTLRPGRFGEDLDAIIEGLDALRESGVDFLDVYQPSSRLEIHPALDQVLGDYQFRAQFFHSRRLKLLFKTVTTETDDASLDRFFQAMQIRPEAIGDAINLLLPHASRFFLGLLQGSPITTDAWASVTAETNAPTSPASENSGPSSEPSANASTPNGEDGPISAP